VVPHHYLTMVSERYKNVVKLRSQNRRYSQYVLVSGMLLFSGYQTLLTDHEHRDGSAESVHSQNLRKLHQTDDIQAADSFWKAMESTDHDHRNLLESYDNDSMGPSLPPPPLPYLS
jgi:hypothetical protein